MSSDAVAAADDPDPALERDLEALLFSAGEPLDLETLTAAVAHHGQPTASQVEAALHRLQTDFPVDGERGIELAELAGGWAFRTNARCAQALESFFDLPREPAALSAAAMETLAAIAYLQPVTRADITQVRGVNSDSCVQTLLDRDLIAEVGRRSPGGAILYGTTRRFEITFGLPGLESLPPLDRFSLDDAQMAELRSRLSPLPDST